MLRLEPDEHARAASASKSQLNIRFGQTVSGRSFILWKAAAAPGLNGSFSEILFEVMNVRPGFLLAHCIELTDSKLPPRQCTTLIAIYRTELWG